MNDRDLKLYIDEVLMTSLVLKGLNVEFVVTWLKKGLKKFIAGLLNLFGP